MKSKKNARPIYTDDYYRMEKMVHDPEFKQEVDSVFLRFRKFGCPVPVNGFRSDKLYMEWLNKVLSLWARIDSSKDFADAYNDIEKDPSLTYRQIFQRKQEFLENSLPPIPGHFIERLLKGSGLDPKNKKYYDFLASYLFLGEKHLSERPFNLTWRRNASTDKFELLIQLLPHTKREHITAGWSQIAKEQKRFSDYIGKSKKWERFEKDLEIYHAYEKERLRVTRKKDSKAWFISGSAPIDETVWAQLHKKYPKITLQQIRSSVSRIKRLDIA